MDNIGKYEILETVGKGGMGAVYKAKDTIIDRIVAIKVIHPHFVEEDIWQDLQLRFQQEAKAAARCLHTNIVTIFDYGMDNDTPYLVMEYVEGVDVKSLLDSKKILPIEQAVGIVIQILDALTYAHKHGVVHRDIKPANIILLADGQIKVADFGVARIDSSELTNAGDMVGTPYYMSPEALRGDVVDARSDLYAAALVLLELITGQRPSTGYVDHEAIREQMQAAKIAFDDINFFADLFLAALHRKPDQRLQSAESFAQKLKSFMQKANDEQDFSATIISADPLANIDIINCVTSKDQNSGITPAPHLLTKLERSLATYIGPLSSVLVNRVTTTSTSIEQLINDLAKHIPNQKERAEFLHAVKAEHLEQSSPAHVDITTSANSSVLKANNVLDISPERLASISVQLAFFLGPMAPVMVKKMLKKASSESELLSLLAMKIPNEKERQQFVSKLEQQV